MRSALVISALILTGSLGCRMLDTTPRPATSNAPALPGQSTAVFTTARASVGQVLSDFIGSHEKTPQQPVEFPHNIHYGKKISCTEYCHESVTTGPVAGLPSVRTCMVCHNAIASGDVPRASFSFKTTSAIAASQVIASYTPSPRVPLRYNGCAMRSG